MNPRSFFAAEVHKRLIFLNFFYIKPHAWRTNLYSRLQPRILEICQTVSGCFIENLNLFFRIHFYLGKKIQKPRKKCIFYEKKKATETAFLNIYLFILFKFSFQTQAIQITYSFELVSTVNSVMFFILNFSICSDIRKSHFIKEFTV